MNPDPISVAVLMTCHNRKNLTLACLSSLMSCSLPDKTELQVVLVDDGSTDGTSFAVKRDFPSVNILKGDGNLYWNGGMRYAFSYSIQNKYDFSIWLNDDTILFKNSILQLLNTYSFLKDKYGKPAIIVGSTVDSISGRLTYGGRISKSFFHPLKYHLMQPGKKPLLCDTMNGNCVLIPLEISSMVGNLDSVFTHSMGDNDYSFRARKLGFQTWVSPGIIGTCSKNDISNTFMDISLNRLERLKKILHKKNLPLRPWYVFTRRHAGPFWPLYWLWPYLKVYFGLDKLFRK